MQDIMVVNPCRVELDDFDYKRDVQLRLHLEKLNTTAIHVLEEILYSPLKVSIEELCDHTDVDYSEIFAILESLLPLGLFTIENDTLLVNKELRKYFETLIEKFNEDFTPDLDYFKGLLKHVPMHSIVSWYHIPRTSNNIFSSIIEKHFKTPKTYEKYVKETLSFDPMIKDIVETIIASPTGQVAASVIMEKFDLDEEKLEEIILFLEYHYILASSYEIEDDHYKKYLSLFSEWKMWKKGSKTTDDELSLHEDEIIRTSDAEFSFIEDMSQILELCEEHELNVAFNQQDELFYLADDCNAPLDLHNVEPSYIARVINKNLLLGLCVIEEDVLKQTPPAKKWLETPIRKRTLITFKHPHNSLSHKSEFSFHQHDRNIIEIQKALSTIDAGKWIMFGEFMQKHLSTGNALKQAELKRIGGTWKFESAEYDSKELEFIRLVVLGWLFESGMVIPGKYQDEDCFKVTSLIYELYS